MSEDLTPEEEFDKYFEEGTDPADAVVEPDKETPLEGDDPSEPDNEPVAEEGAAAEPEEATEPGEEKKEPDPALDPFANATDEQRQYLDAIRREKEAEILQIRNQLQQTAADRDAWAHKYRSDEGRIKAAQERLAQQPTGPTKEQALAALQDTESWKEFKETWSEHAEILEAFGESLAERFQQQIQATQTHTSQDIEQLQRQHHELMRQRAHEQMMQGLDARIPGWRDIDQSPEFRAWVEAQPQSRQEYIINNARNGMLDETAGVFADFQNYQRAAEYAEQQKRATEVAEKREKRLERSATIPPDTGTLGKPTEEAAQDFDTVFESITRPR